MKSYLIFNKKGGQGKTTLAVSFCKYIKGNYITNDENNYTEEVFNITTSIIKRDDGFNEINLSETKPNVFDFGGFSDDRVNVIAEISSVCIVPIYYQSVIDLRVALEVMETLKKYNKNSIFVITNTEKKHIDILKSFLEEKAKTFVIPKSTFMTNNSETIFEQFDLAEPLAKHTIKPTLKKCKALFEYILSV